LEELMAVRILLIDDEPALLEIAKTFLQREKGYKVDVSLSAEEALDILKRDRFDVIISDYYMPGMNGIELLKKLKSAGDTTPYILFTGRGTEDVAIDALNNGASFYLKKGGDPKSQFVELVNMIETSAGQARAKELLRTSEEKYRRLVELAQEGIWVIDPNAITTYVNPRMAEMLGYTTEEMMGRPIFAFMDERGKEVAQTELDRRKHGVNEAHDAEFLRKDGQRVYAILQTASMMDEAGNFSGGIAVLTDITARRLAEHQANERMKELSAFYSLAEMTEREGITIDQLCRELADILPKSWQYPEISCCRVVIGANEFRTENFSESPWMLSAPVRVNRSVAGRIDVGYLEKMPESDEGPFMKEERLLINAIAERLGRIAERKKAELNLTSAMTMLKEAQHLAHIGTWDWLVEGDVVTWSEELYNINGRDSSLPAPSFAEQSRLFTPTSWERLSSAVKGALTTGEPYNLELELVRSDGSIRWTNGIGGVRRDEKGKVIGLHGILQDITERRRAEEALRQANKKLNLLGSVTRHDAINQLSVVFAWLEIAKEVAARDEPVHEHLARVGEAAKMIRRQLEFTADYQEIGVKRPEWMDLADAVNRGVEGLGKGKMSLNIDVAGVQVFADSMLEKVFHNLVENALRHGEKAKSISISARETKEGMTIVCEDDGVGIPAGDKEKVFLRGFGKNTGFGLYMVREVLDMTGIRVRETGVPGKGARFELLVPAGNYRIGHPGQ
jgi:PAS domain S-box-containing protein